jgi:hypothetical protein
MNQTIYGLNRLTLKLNSLIFRLPNNLIKIIKQMKNKLPKISKILLITFHIIFNKFIII